MEETLELAELREAIANHSYVEIYQEKRALGEDLWRYVQEHTPPEVKPFLASLPLYSYDSTWLEDTPYQGLPAEVLHLFGVDCAVWIVGMIEDLEGELSPEYKVCLNAKQRWLQEEISAEDLQQAMDACFDLPVRSATLRNTLALLEAANALDPEECARLSSERAMHTFEILLHEIRFPVSDTHRLLEKQQLWQMQQLINRIFSLPWVAPSYDFSK